MDAKFIKRVALLLTMVLALVLVVGCGNNDEQKADNKALDQAQVIKVGYFPNVTHAQALVGFNDGSFKKALGDNITIKEQTFNAGPAEIEALLAGEVDLGYIGPVPAINGFVKSKGEIKIIAGASNGGAILVARKGSNIKSVKDLAGKKVAIPQLGNTQDISLRNLLATDKLQDAAKGGTVTVIPAENADILTLISKGDIDAALVPEPWGSRIVKQAGANVVLDNKDVWRDGNYATTVVIVRKKFLDENPGLVEKWLKAHMDVTELINKDKVGSQKIINDQLNKLTKKPLPEDVLKTSFDRLTVTYNPESASIKDFVKLSFDNGYIKEKPDTGNLFDFSLLNKILKSKGLATVK